MERSGEFHTGFRAGDPAHARFEGFEAVELDPQLLVELRPLDEFGFAAVRREIVDVDPEADLAGPAHHHLALDRHALVTARLLRSRFARLGAFERQPRPCAVDPRTTADAVPRPTTDKLRRSPAVRLAVQSTPQPSNDRSTTVISRRSRPGGSRMRRGHGPPLAPVQRLRAGLGEDLRRLSHRQFVLWSRRKNQR